MDKLFKGIIEFRETDYKYYKELFKKIGKSQDPHTLFIGCCDSRIDPALITKTLPGELFIVRNIANIVPYYRDTEEYVATTSAIEYAVEILNVENIVVCGHSNCGGCAALYKPDSFFKDIPHVKKWLELSKNVKDEILKQMNSQNDFDEVEKMWMTEQINIVEQMDNLLTYPFIKEKYENGKLNIYG
ncbi:MAG TPA: carbonic anhydrase, partial [Spirochaetota bacterium]|nr:carbonic anhydrase [Spirochaetota bacterium]